MTAAVRGSNVRPIGSMQAMGVEPFIRLARRPTRRRSPSAEVSLAAETLHTLRLEIEQFARVAA
jgi:hypothetical protein